LKALLRWLNKRTLAANFGVHFFLYLSCFINFVVSVVFTLHSRSFSTPTEMGKRQKKETETEARRPTRGSPMARGESSRLFGFRGCATGKHEPQTEWVFSWQMCMSIAGLFFFCFLNFLEF